MSKAVNINNVTAAHIKRGIKKGLGMQAFCDSFHCTENELKTKIHKIYSSDFEIKQGKADKIIGQIMKNDETSSLVEDRFRATKEGEEIYEISRTCKRNKGKKQAFKSSESSEGEPVKEPEMTEPESVEVPERKAKDELARFRVNDETIEEIQKRETPVIYAFEDGTIKAKDDSLELNDTGSSELLSELLQGSDYEDYKIKDLKYAVRIIATLINIDMEVELMIYNEDVSEIVAQIIRNQFDL